MVRSRPFSEIAAESANRIARKPNEIPTAKIDPIYYGGEMGVFYGHSVGGKHSADEFGSYLVGTVGNRRLELQTIAA